MITALLCLILSISVERSSGLNFANFKTSINNRNQPNKIDSIKSNLLQELSKYQPNGLKASPIQQREINEIVLSLEKLNPTASPAKSPKMNGFWKLLYTDFNPPAESSGKIGPFVADVYQDLNAESLIIKNILDLKFPSIRGGLVANLTIPNKQIWQIEFDRVGNRLFGFKLPTKKFEKGKQIRIWKITYLDDNLRVMRAGRPENKESEYFTFILQRDDKNKFEIDV